MVFRQGKHRNTYERAYMGQLLVTREPGFLKSRTMDRSNCKKGLECKMARDDGADWNKNYAAVL